MQFVSKLVERAAANQLQSHLGKITRLVRLVFYQIALRMLQLEAYCQTGLVSILASPKALV